MQCTTSQAVNQRGVLVQIVARDMDFSLADMFKNVWSVDVTSTEAIPPYFASRFPQKVD